MRFNPIRYFQREKMMSGFLRFSIVAACVFSVTTSVFGQQSRSGSSQIAWPYHPNRVGVEAYMQGGAFVANTGDVTAMLFNPAGLAKMPGRLTATVETGWASETEYLQFFNVNFATGFQPVQFAGVAFQPWSKLSVGAFYTRPTNYDLEVGGLEIVDENDPAGTGDFVDALIKREQTSLGLTLATAFGEQLYIGGSLEWRRSSIQEEIIRTRAEGDADGARFSLGAIIQVSQWSFGVAAQSKYEASGDITFKNTAPLVGVDIPPGQRGNNAFYPVRADEFPFDYEEPAAIRFGVATPHAFGRVSLSADAEYKDFDSEAPIEPWQFYGGGNLLLTSNLQLGFGAFTFRKDYSAFIDGPESETFWTVGGVLELSQFRFSGSFMDSDLFSQDFVGQQFINFAISYVIP
jgi:hypothetical protein